MQPRSLPNRAVCIRLPRMREHTLMTSGSQISLSGRPQLLAVKATERAVRRESRLKD